MYKKKKIPTEFETSRSFIERFFAQLHHQHPVKQPGLQQAISEHN